MSFDPSKVDLSLVEPALRPEVLRRVTVLEEFTRSRGPAARRKACDALGISHHQLYLLARAWTARRRAEDITLRATKRHRPTTLPPEVLRIIGEVADLMPDANGVETAREAERRIIDAGFTPPTRPTIGKYIREASAARGIAALNDIGADLLIDVIVSDIPALGARGDRVRPQLIVLAEGVRGELVAIDAVTDMVMTSDLKSLLLRAMPDPAQPAVRPCHRSGTVVVSVPDGTATEWFEGVLSPLGMSVVTRAGAAGRPGAVATALLGTSVGSYKLRRKLVGSPASKRKAAYPDRQAVDATEAASFIASVVRDGQDPPMTVLDEMPSDWLMRVATALAPAVDIAERASSVEDATSGEVVSCRREPREGGAAS